MKLFRLTAFSLVTLSVFFFFASCETDEEMQKVTEFAKSEIPMTGAQETPANTSTALGKLSVFYTRETRILSYTFQWSGLAGNPVAMHVHGPAPTGYAALPLQTISTSGLSSTGTKSGTLLVDGVAIKEQDLLNGFYYINIHTAAYPAGEIRAQIVFQ